MPPDLANQFNPSLYQAEYSITPIAVEIQDTGKGKKFVLEDLEAVLNYWARRLEPRQSAM